LFAVTTIVVYTHVYYQCCQARLEALSRTLAKVKADKASEISQLEQGNMPQLCL